METWIPVVGFEGLYEVSDLGRVRSLARVVVGRSRWGGQQEYPVKQRVLRQMTTNGYKHVSLARAGVSRNFRVHRLVCLSFVGPAPSPDHQVAHNNGDKTDNRPSNLRWATPKDNCLDRVCHGTDLLGSKSHLAVLTEADIPKIRRLRKQGFTLEALGRQFGVDQSTISLVARHATWRHVV